MPTVASIEAQLAIDSGRFDAGLRAAGVSFDRFGDNLKLKSAAIEAQIAKSQEKMAGVFKAAAIGVSGFLGYGIKKALDLDSLTRALTAVTGSAAKTQEQLLRLREVAKAPGLGFEEAVRGSLNLQAAGLSAKMAEKALTEFGNALALSGKGKADLDGVILALTQIIGKGKVSAEEINQIAERFAGIRPILAKAFGTASTEDIQKLGITAEQFIGRVLAEMEKLQRVQGGPQIALENLGDAFNSAASSAAQIFLPVMEKTAGVLTAMAAAYNALPEPIKAVTSGTLALAVAGVGIAQAAKVIKEMQAGFLLLKGATIGAETGMLKAALASSKFATALAAVRATLVSLAPLLLSVAAAVAALGYAYAKLNLAKKAEQEANAILALAKARLHLTEVMVKTVDDAAKKGVKSLIALKREFFNMPEMVEAVNIKLREMGYALKVNPDFIAAGANAFKVWAESTGIVEQVLESQRQSRNITSIADRLGLGSNDVAKAKANLDSIDDAIKNLIDAGKVKMAGAALAGNPVALAAINRLLSDRKAALLQVAAAQRAVTMAQNQADYENSLIRINELVRNILSSEMQRRKMPSLLNVLGLGDDGSQVDKAKAKLDSIDNAIKQIIEVGNIKLSEGPVLGFTGNKDAMTAMNKLLSDREHALIQVAAAERMANIELNRMNYAASQSGTIWGSFIEKARELYNAIHFSGTVWGPYIKGAIDAYNASHWVVDRGGAIRNFFKGIVDSVKAFQTERLQNYKDLMQGLSLEMLKYSKGAKEAAIAALMLNQSLTRGQAESVVQMQSMIDSMKQMKELADDIAGSIADAFIDGLKRVQKEGFAGFLAAFEQMLLDMALAVIRAQVFNLLQGILGGLIGGVGGVQGGGGGGGGYGSTGGTGQTQTGFGMMQQQQPIQIVMNIQTPDASSFRRSQDQIMDSAFRTSLAFARRSGA